MPEEDSQPAEGPRRSLAQRLIVGGLLAALAFAATVQLRQDDADTYSGVRSVELVELLKSLDSANGRLNEQIDELTTVRDELQNSSSASETAQKEAQRRLDELSILAGTVGATGPGVRITITDVSGSIGASTVLDTVQELRDAGAEAIVINGHARVVAQTWFADDTDGIRVAGALVEPPYVIEAIGDPATLDTAIDFRGGIADRISNRGGSAAVVRVDTITITALAETVTPEYSHPQS